ncbi:hypothetical protein IQ266_19285 [filamentous cyanobacterium LEGE 11480]|uniref:Uncharacterized protein n=1 Tax=Romeriopsis navalis LEGE 11480 TaxID=2777977 RepID=A0A928VST0_9CYAN|nr:hypothetical protein [Romeriopsis navalis]MBE9031882.1 hypothetical protein [Romeriopsis navalis LEGE 11480]
MSNGEVWQFGLLDRQTKCVTQVLTSHLIPKKLETVQRILIKVLLP